MFLSLVLPLLYFSFNLVSQKQKHGYSFGVLFLAICQILHLCFTPGLVCQLMEKLSVWAGVDSQWDWQF